MPENDYRLRIRMYRQGLGDCFLLTTGGDPPHRQILIDCGVLKGSPDGKERIRQVVQDIAETTGGRLDLLVATHEHWDHLSGFSDQQAQDLFDTIRIDRIWMGWTEKAGDPQADALHARFDKQKQTLHMALESTAVAEERAMVEPLLRFFGYDGGLMPFAFAQTTRDALNYLHERGRNTDVVCCEPGEVRRLSHDDGLKFYLLGPPREEKLLKKDLPRKGSHESYDFAAAALFRDFFVGTRAMSELRDQYPFDPDHRIVDPAAGTKALAKLLQDLQYTDARQAWRKLNPDNLGLATELALQMDSDTNNTSLALAIELEQTGEVLLFPADAQIGNWQSWHTVRFAGEPDLKMEELLRRTVFYKVGHHGSHNATLREGGLELMSHPGLVAMIPVAGETAEKLKWKMPAFRLNEVLREKTRGRLLRLDTGFDHDGALPPVGLTQAGWEKFQSAVSVEDLYVEYRL